jgi:CheY-like chemotaxis protein
MTSRCKCVLVVEDEELIRENLQLLLELEGYSVFTASNGQEGLEQLRKIPHPCLILLDLLMPVMNGMEFLAAKAQEDAVASIPVCVVSGVADPPHISGITAFVKKPVEFNQLLEFVKRYCGEPR